MTSAPLFALVLSGAGSGLLSTPAVGQSMWVETAQFATPDGFANGPFGATVALESGLLAVGDPEQGSHGAVHLYEVGTGTLQFSVISTGPDSDFGRSLAIDGTNLAVGALGAAYLVDTATGTVVNEFPSGPGGVDRDFGRCVAIEGRMVFVGAPGDADDIDGEVWAFSPLGGGTRIVLTPESPRDHEVFGSSIDTAEGWIMIGAPGIQSVPVAVRGAVYVFDRQTLDQVYRLQAPLSQAMDLFGHAVAVDERLAAISGRDDEGRGVVYIYDLNDGSFAGIAQPLLVRDESYGRTLALEQQTLAVGSGRTYDLLASQRTVTIFDLGRRQQTGLLQPENVNPDVFGFGDAIALDGNRLAVGRSDPSGAEATGMVHLYEAVDPLPLELMITGACGEEQELTVTGASTGGNVLFFVGGGDPVWLPSLPNCPGARIEFGRIHVEMTATRADATGLAVNFIRLKPSQCGLVKVQALDNVTCRTSNVATP